MRTNFPSSVGKELFCSECQEWDLSKMWWVWQLS